MVERVAVLGGGSLAHAMAGDLSLRGYKVALFELAGFAKKLDRLFNTRTIEMVGKIEATACIDRVTGDIRDAIKDAEIIFVAVPAHAQERFTELMLPFLKAGQQIVMTPGNYGSIALGTRLGERRTRGVLIGETSACPYTSRLIAPARVRIIGIRKTLLVSAFPSKDNSALVDSLNSIYGGIVTQATSSVEAALNNLNPVVHPCGVILNSGSVELAFTKSRDYYMYREGISDSVAGVIERVDKERAETARGLGYNVTSMGDRNAILDFLQHPDLLDAVGPRGLSDRYLIEDIPYGLVPLSGLAKLVGNETPVVDALITIGSILMRRDYLGEGRNLQKLGIHKLSVDQVKRFLELGFT